MDLRERAASHTGLAVTFTTHGHRIDERMASQRSGDVARRLRLAPLTLRQPQSPGARFRHLRPLPRRPGGVGPGGGVSSESRIKAFLQTLSATRSRPCAASSTAFSSKAGGEPPVGSCGRRPANRGSPKTLDCLRVTRRLAVRSMRSHITSLQPCFCSARPPASSATSIAWPLNTPGARAAGAERASSASKQTPHSPSCGRLRVRALALHGLQHRDDRHHYGHLARDSRGPALSLLDSASHRALPRKQDYDLEPRSLPRVPVLRTGD
jgi:hypothetical protein